MWKYSPGHSVKPSAGDSSVLGGVSKVERASGNLEPGPGHGKISRCPKERGGSKGERRKSSERAVPQSSRRKSGWFLGA